MAEQMPFGFWTLVHSPNEAAAMRLKLL